MTPAPELVTVSRKELDDLRAFASLQQVLVEDFVSDGAGDVHGPHLAEPEVWARLAELEATVEHPGPSQHLSADARANPKNDFA